MLAQGVAPTNGPKLSHPEPSAGFWEQGRSCPSVPRAPACRFPPFLQKGEPLSNSLGVSSTTVPASPSAVRRDGLEPPGGRPRHSCLSRPTTQFRLWSHCGGRSTWRASRLRHGHCGSCSPAARVQPPSPACGPLCTGVRPVRRRDIPSRDTPAINSGSFWKNSLPAPLLPVFI